MALAHAVGIASKLSASGTFAKAATGAELAASRFPTSEGVESQVSAETADQKGQKREAGPTSNDAGPLDQPEFDHGAPSARKPIDPRI